MTAQPATVRRFGIGLVAACAALLTSACAAGQVVQTAEQTPAVDGSNSSVGDIQLHAVAIKAPAVNCYLPGSSAALTFVVVNRGSQDATLTDITSPRFGSWAVAANGDDAAAFQRADAGTGSCAPQPSGSAGSAGSSPAAAPGGPSEPLPKAGNSLTIKAGHQLSIGVGQGEQAAADQVVLVRQLTGGPLWPGNAVQMTFTFGQDGATTFTVPVQLSTVPNNLTIPSPGSTTSPIE